MGPPTSHSSATETWRLFFTETGTYLERTSTLIESRSQSIDYRVQMFVLQIAIPGSFVASRPRLL